MSAAITAEEINAYLAEAFPISGQRCIDVGERWALAAITPDERARRPGNIISGPTIFGLCDAVLWYALFGAVGLEPMALTSELSIPSAGRPSGELEKCSSTSSLVTRYQECAQASAITIPQLYKLSPT